MVEEEGVRLGLRCPVLYTHTTGIATGGRRAAGSSGRLGNDTSIAAPQRPTQPILGLGVGVLVEGEMGDGGVEAGPSASAGCARTKYLASSTYMQRLLESWQGTKYLGTSGR